MMIIVKNNIYILGIFIVSIAEMMLGRI